jgi:hypothetical protein
VQALRHCYNTLEPIPIKTRPNWPTRDVDGLGENLDDGRDNVINDVANAAKRVVATNIAPGRCM